MANLLRPLTRTSNCQSRQNTYKFYPLLAVCALWLANVGPAHSDTVSLNELKQATVAGDGAAAADLITALLETVPSRMTGNTPNANLFAAQCWWQLSRTTIIDAVESGTVGNRHFMYLDSVWRNYDEALMLTPGQLKSGETEYTYLDPDYQKAQVERWGPGANDPYNLTHRVLNETMPALAAAQPTSAAEVPTAIAKAEALSAEHPDRPEPYAFIAQLHMLTGNAAAAKENAHYALSRFPGHYLAHQVLATVEFHELRSNYVCDSALAWQRLVQADNYNIQSIQLVQSLVNLYQTQPDRQRLIDLREQLWKRVGHDDMVAKMAQEGRDLGERRWYTDEEIHNLRDLMNQVDAALTNL